MLKSHKIFEHLAVIITGFALYETIYFRGNNTSVFDSAYFFVVFPIVFCTIASFVVSTATVRELHGRMKSQLSSKLDIKKLKFGKKGWTLLFLSSYFEIRVMAVSFDQVNERTTVCFIVGFFLAKCTMYTEIFSNLDADGELTERKPEPKVSVKARQQSRKRKR